MNGQAKRDLTEKNILLYFDDFVPVVSCGYFHFSANRIFTKKDNKEE